jgi:DNA-binding MarR family transcriptional regulator
VPPDLRGVARAARSAVVADARHRRGTTTPAGLELIDKVTDAHLANERRLLGALSDTDRRQLADLLRKPQLGLPR